MQDEEILRLTGIFAGLRFDKLRLTGGEPILRANVVKLVDNISHSPVIQTISMTTNCILLSNLAEPLASAGLQRVNISIDTLDPVKFKRLTCLGNVKNVLAGILATERDELQPVKLNVVVVRGNKREDVVDLAHLSVNHPWQVRNIEMMPFADATAFQTGQMVTAAETRI